MPKLFLGLDSSTQSLSAVVIDLDTRKVVYEKSLNFDQALPHYKTKNGVLTSRDPLVKHSSPLMWAEALDLIFAAMKKDRVALGDILAVSGSGQQHGSVYFNDRITAALENLDPKKSLVENLHGVFARKTSPIWMDSSTAVECAGDPQETRWHQIHRLAHRLGRVRAVHRAADPEIFQEAEPDAYTKTCSASRW